MTLSGLSCDTTYYFRARASNSVGSATPGQILSFRTDVCGGGGGTGTQPLLTNGTFESGYTGWIAQNSFYIDAQPCPYSGSRYAFLAQADGTRGDNLFGTLDQVITIPSTATAVDLSYRYSIQTSDPSTEPKDVLTVWIYNSSGSTALELLESYSNRDAQNGCGSSYYTKESFSLLQYKGQSIRLRFLGTTDSRAGTPTVFRIDTVSVVATVPQASAPEVTTDAADQITASSARLNMTVNPNGDETTVWFDLEAGDSTPDDDTEHILMGSGSQSQSVNISAFGLDCGTLYYFRARASNSEGSDSGSIRSFTTSPCAGGPPGADTDPAQNITQTSATLTADVDPNGLLTQAWFAWGTTPSLGQETPHDSVGSGTANVDFTQTLSGLTCGTTYYFQNRASSSAGQDSGTILSFDTLPCDGGGPPTQGFFLDSSRQGCSGSGPAVLLWWTAPAEMDDVFTVRRTDDIYTATVDASQGGMWHLVSSLLIPGETYSFRVEGTLNGAPVQTNAVTVPVISDECRLPVGVGEFPHLPLVWAGSPFCSGGTASVPLHWTTVEGADSYTLTRIDNDAGQLIPYPGLNGTGTTDTDLVPGTAYEYMLDAVGSGGSRRATRISVFIASGICGEPSTPGPFSAQVSTPVCEAGTGAVTLSWTPVSGAASGIGTKWSDDGFTSGSGRTFTGSSKVIDGQRPGALVKLMVQAESDSTPLQYRSLIMAQRIPLDICGGGTLPPVVNTVAATYIQEQQALLRASIVPNADSSISYFEWGTSPSFGSTTPMRNAGDGYRNVGLGETLTGLACNTTYYFRALAANPIGQTPGATLQFTTKPCSTSLPTVTVSATDPEASEQPLRNGEFLIQRSGSTAGDLTVTYSVGGTATAGQDHTLAGGSVVIPAGSSAKALAVVPLDDQVAEGDETVVVTLQGQPHYQVGQPGSATVTIASDEVPGGGGCGNVLVQQPRDEFGGCDTAEAGVQRVAENFRLVDGRKIACLEILGYYWPNNDPPPTSIFDVVFRGVANDGAPGAVIHEDRGLRVQRQKTGTVSFGLEEWRFTIELPNAVELAAGNYFAEVIGSAPTDGSVCWIGGRLDPAAGLNGMAFDNTGQWSLGTWDLAFKLFEAKTEIFMDGFESGTTEKWDPWP